VRIWTIGHTTRTIDEFISLLQANQIRLLADVRSLPGSKRYPQFNKEALANALGKADAEAASIYAAAFNPPDAQELYTFLRSLDVMRAAFEKDTTAVISTNSDLGRMLKSMAEAVAPPKPAR
jgi:uncharacterized protein (DUF488 family)